MPFNLILLYYLLYLVLVRSGNTAVRLAVGAAVPFLLLVAIRHTCGFIDPRVLRYYWLFVAGVLASRFDLLESKNVNAKRAVIDT